MPGARYLKVDLHFHTPASRDYRGSSDFDGIMARVAALGIDLIAVTDHNTIQGIKPSRLAAEKFDIIVLPGVEVSTAEGHLLAIFDLEKPSEEIDAWLTQLGFPPAKRGDDQALAGGDKPISMIDVCERIENEGGVAIAAHVCTKSIGFWETLKTRGALRAKIHACRHLRGLEVTDKGQIRFVSGGISQDYPKRYGCVMGSDSHCLDEVGQRYTWIKLGSPGVFALKHALTDPTSRIFFDAPPSASGPKLKQITVSDGFFKDVVFDFHPELNCVIGGKGVGKSLLIELCRFALAIPSGIDVIEKDSNSKIQSRLGPDAVVTMIVSDEDGTDYRIERSYGSDPTCFRAHDLHELEVLPRDIFPLNIFSQGEFIEIARQPKAQLQWIDEWIDVTSQRREIETARRQARELGKRIAGLSSLTALRTETERKLKAFEMTIEPLQRKLKDPVLKEFPLWAKEKRFFDDAIKALESLKSEVSDALDGVRLELREPEKKEELPTPELVKRAWGIARDCLRTVESAKKSIEKEIDKRRTEIEILIKPWKTQFEAKNRAYAELLTQAQAKNQTEISQKLLGIQKQMGELKKQIDKIAEAETQMEVLLQQRDKALANLTSAYQQIFEKRKQKAEEITTLTNEFVLVKVEPMGDRSDYLNKLSATLRGLRLSEDIKERLATALSPVEFPRAFLDPDSYPDLRKKINFLGDDRFVKIADHLRDVPLEELYEFQLVELSDRASISLRLEGGNYRTLERLSDGQRCTALLAIALVETNRPLIIDQPEDALDNPYVFRGLVQSIRRQRRNRQLIFTTHNPNLVVASDADLVITLAADDEHGRIENCGSIDLWATRGHVLTNIEGAEEAFYLRGQKYSIDFTDPTRVIFSDEDGNKS